MKKTLVVLVICVLFSIALAQWNQDIWNRYRHELVRFFSPRYCQERGQGFNNACQDMDTTVFQFVDEPKDALFESSPQGLNEDICKFVPKWSTTFEPRCAGIDCTFEKVYDSMIKKFPDAAAGGQQYLAFARSPRDSFADVKSSLPWREVEANKLQNFLNEMANTPDSAVQFEVDVDRNVPVTANDNQWGLKVPLYAADKPFMRTINYANGPQSDFGGFLSDQFKVAKVNGSLDTIKTVKPASDDEEEEEEEIEDDIDAAKVASDFLFRRRRSSPPVVVAPVAPTIIQTNTFKVKFIAKGLRSIRIQPGQWFDKNFIEANKPNLRFLFGPNGEMPLVPETIYVAYKPRVEMTVSESQLGAIKSDLDNPSIYAFLIGGAHFKNKQVIPLSDAQSSEPADEIYWELIDETSSTTDTAPVIKAAEKKKLRMKLLEKSREYEEEAENEISEETMSEFLFRRRRGGSPPPPPPPPPPQVERNYRIVFQSNSPTPQIIGVVSRILG